MSRDTIKKIVLGVLVLMLIWVWTNAFRADESESDGYRVRPVAASPPRDATDGLLPEYTPPKINPFWRPVRQPSEDPVSLGTGGRAEQVQKVSANYRLSGVLPRGKSSQAVVSGPNGATSILSINDSLGCWRLISVSGERAVFGRGKEQDTLRLYAPH